MPGDAPVVVNSAGCGAAMKDYGRLLGTAEAHAFGARVRDFSEWVAEHDIPLRATGATARRAGPVSPPARATRAGRSANRARPGVHARGDRRRRTVLRRGRRIRAAATRAGDEHPRPQGRGPATRGTRSGRRVRQPRLHGAPRPGRDRRAPSRRSARGRSHGGVATLDAAKPPLRGESDHGYRGVATLDAAQPPLRGESDHGYRGVATLDAAQPPLRGESDHGYRGVQRR